MKRNHRAQSHVRRLYAPAVPDWSGDQQKGILNNLHPTRYIYTNELAYSTRLVLCPAPAMTHEWGGHVWWGPKARSVMDKKDRKQTDRPYSGMDDEDVWSRIHCPSISRFELRCNMVGSAPKECFTTCHSNQQLWQGNAGSMPLCSPHLSVYQPLNGWIWFALSSCMSDNVSSVDTIPVVPIWYQIDVSNTRQHI